MTSPPSPPRLAQRLLRLSLSPADRQPQLGDLQEEFATLADADPARAARWYWRQTLTSVVPNLARRIRHGWQLISRINDEKDRKSRQWRRWFGVALAAMGVALGVGISISKGDWRYVYDGMPFLTMGLLVSMSGFYGAIVPHPRSRRWWMFQILWIFPTAVTFTKAATHLLASDTLTWMWPIYLLQTLLWFWPRGTWPFHRPLAVSEHSLRSPVYFFRQYGRQNYELIKVPNLPVAMSAPILGPAAPVSVPAESQIDGVVPMCATESRSFAATDSLRVFTVVNAAPDDLQAAVEIRRVSTGRLLGTVPATVALATPKLTPQQAFAIDPDDEPLAPAPIRVSEVNTVISLAGLAPGDYTLRIVAHHPEGSSFEHVDITVRPELGRR